MTPGDVDAMADVNLSVIMYKKGDLRLVSIELYILYLMHYNLII